MISVVEIAKLINGTVEGNHKLQITGVCNLREGKENCISFLGNPKYKKYLMGTNASVIIVEKNSGISNNGKTLIEVDNPNQAFAKVLEKLLPKQKIKSGVHNSAIIASNVKFGEDIIVEANVVIKENVILGKETFIGAGVIIGDGTIIGDNCDIHPNVILYPKTIIGDNVHIDSGTVIGADGFGWNSDNKNHYQIPQIGNVVIEDNVFIGANCCIDRATFDKTIIGSGTKMDNLIQIAHNVRIGKNCLIAGGVAIAGSTIIGDWVTIAGQVGIIEHLNIGNKTIIASKSAVYKSVSKGSFISGIPARNHSDRLKQDIAISQLPELYKRIRQIEESLNIKKN